MVVVGVGAVKLESGRRDEKVGKGKRVGGVDTLGNGV